MRKKSLLLAAALLISLLAGCGARKTASSTAGSSAAEARPLHLKELNVELSRTEKNLGALQSALENLPDTLKGALAERNVKVDEIHVTVGSSASATCEALKAGGVDLAFLPADSFAALDGGKAILASGTVCPAAKGTDPADWNGNYGGRRDVGSRALICAAATEYGKNLAERVSSGKTLTWEELDHARWGVLAQSSQPGYQCAELWLADHYKGMGLENLSGVKTYSSEKELVSAAAAGEIDVFPIQADTRSDYTAQWPKIQTQAAVLGVSGKLYAWVAAVSSKLGKNIRFQDALLDAVNAMEKKDPQAEQIFGADPYLSVKDSALDGMRRIQSGGEGA